MSNVCTRKVLDGRLQGREAGDDLMVIGQPVLSSMKTRLRRHDGRERLANDVSQTIMQEARRIKGLSVLTRRHEMVKCWHDDGFDGVRLTGEPW